MDELSTLQPVDYFERLYQHRYGEAAPAELLAAFAELVHASAEAGARA
jgi:hypothetical protein